MSIPPISTRRSGASLLTGPRLQATMPGAPAGALAPSPAPLGHARPTARTWLSYAAVALLGAAIAGTIALVVLHERRPDMAAPADTPAAQATTATAAATADTADPAPPAATSPSPTRPKVPAAPMDLDGGHQDGDPCATALDAATAGRCVEATRSRSHCPDSDPRHHRVHELCP